MEIKDEEFVKNLLLLPKEDRIIILSNAETLMIRQKLEKAKNEGKK